MFNDPFDVPQELQLNFNEAELNRAFGERLIAIFEGSGSDYAPSTSRLRQLKSVMDDLQARPEIRQSVIDAWRRSAGATTPGQIELMERLKKKWRDEIAPTFRILCLSELNDITSMWYLYAGAYRGVVLEFETVDRLDSAFLSARAVTYQDELPPIANKEIWAQYMSERGPLTLEDFLTGFVYRKTMSWAYEREWRIVDFALDDEPGLFSDTGFFSRELTGVYLGAKCSQEDESGIVALLTHGFEHVAVYKASIGGIESKFTFQRIR